MGRRLDEGRSDEFAALLTPALFNVTTFFRDPPA